MRLILAALLLAASGTIALAAEKKPAPPAQKADLGLITSSTGRPESGGDPQQYCENIADQATEARFAWQIKTIEELEKDIDKRIADLEEKRAEYQAWIKEREGIQAKASEHVVAIYAKMRVEAAAQQMAELDQEMAAALLSKLNARTASAILNEMEPKHAAKLAKAMVKQVRDAKEEDGKKT